tara:strand:+ start:1582 stop:1869 length:288 start_codon:yes stop_codon:yes gene_type:complete
LNVLDLGAWHSLQVAVDKYKRDHRVEYSQLDSPQKPTHRIIELVKKTWEEWISVPRINKLFHDVILVMKEILRVDGDNNFEVPHLQKKKINTIEL